MSAAIKNPIERRRLGIEALAAALGRDEAVAFLDDISFVSDGDEGVPGWNYTKWRQEQPERPFDEVAAELLEMQRAMDCGEIDIAGCKK